MGLSSKRKSDRPTYMRLRKILNTGVSFVDMPPLVVIRSYKSVFPTPKIYFDDRTRCCRQYRILGKEKKRGKIRVIPSQSKEENLDLKVGFIISLATTLEA